MLFLMFLLMSTTFASPSPFDSFDSFVEHVGDVSNRLCAAQIASARVARGLCADVQLLLEDTFEQRIAAFLEDSHISEAYFLRHVAANAGIDAFRSSMSDALRALAADDAAFAHWQTQRSVSFQTHVVPYVDDWFMALFHEVVEENLKQNPPSDDELRRIAQETGVDPDELVEKYRVARLENAVKENPELFDEL